MYAALMKLTDLFSDCVALGGADPSKCSSFQPEPDKKSGHCIEEFTAGFTDPDQEYIYLFYNDNNYIRLESGHQALKFPKVSDPLTSYKEMLISDKFPGVYKVFKHCT